METNSGNDMKTGLSESRIRGTIGYDAYCPVCLSTMARWREVFSVRGFVWVPLHDDFWRGRLGLREGELPGEIQLELATGERITGAAAVMWLARRVWWLSPLGVVGWLPGIRTLTRAVYAWIARNRYCLGDVCTLPQHWRRHRRHHTATTFLELP